jgi:hypothetical protein
MSLIPVRATGGNSKGFGLDAYVFPARVGVKCIVKKVVNASKKKVAWR